MKNSITIIPIITGGCAVVAWVLLFIARAAIDRWIAGGKRGHLHLAWQSLYDKWGREGIVYSHLAFALLMTAVTILGVWRVMTLPKT